MCRCKQAAAEKAVASVSQSVLASVLARAVGSVQVLERA